MIRKSVVCLLRRHSVSRNAHYRCRHTPVPIFHIVDAWCQTRNGYRFICFSLHSSLSLPLPHRTTHTHLNGIQITVYFGIIFYMHIHTMLPHLWFSLSAPPILFHSKYFDRFAMRLQTKTQIFSIWISERS